MDITEPDGGWPSRYFEMSCRSVLGTSVHEAHSKLLDSSEIETFLQNIVRRFELDNEINHVLGPVVAKLCSHQSLNAGFARYGGECDKIMHRVKSAAWTVQCDDMYRLYCRNKGTFGQEAEYFTKSTRRTF